MGRTEYNALNALKHLYEAGHSENALKLPNTSGILNVSSSDQCMLRAFDYMVGFGLVCDFYKSSKGIVV